MSHADPNAVDEAVESADGEQDDDETTSADFGPPFVARSFGGEFVWARASGYECKILRVRANEVVAISTAGRRDMVAMLTGGRAVLEQRKDEGVEHIELLPAEPLAIGADGTFRVVAITEVELWVIYTPAAAG